MDPPPSLACATGTMPLATAAADPPEDPPVEWPVFHGLRAGGNDFGSVVTVVPNSGTLVRPSGTNPAARNCSARKDVTGHGRSFNGPMPKAVGSPATVQPRSLNRIGTPLNGPSGRSPAASARAASKRVRMTASSCGFTASIRAIAASTSSLGDASPVRTRSACAVASSHVLSVIRRTLDHCEIAAVEGRYLAIDAGYGTLRVFGSSSSGLARGGSCRSKKKFSIEARAFASGPTGRLIGASPRPVDGAAGTALGPAP